VALTIASTGLREATYTEPSSSVMAAFAGNLVSLVGAPHGGDFLGQLLG